MVNHRIIIFPNVNPKPALSIRRKNPARNIDKQTISENIVCVNGV
jgi:hypothetical protein